MKVFLDIKKLFSSFFLLLVLIPSSAMAAIPPKTYSRESAIKFFKTPQSLFPSGEVRRRELEKTIRKEHLESSYLVQSGQQMFWLNAPQIVRDLQLSEFAQLKSNKKIYKIQMINSYQAQLINEEGLTLTIPLKELASYPADLGLAMNLIPTQIRQHPSWKSDSLLTIPEGSRLQVLKFDDTWALVNFESVGKISGWVDMSNLIFKFDFAAFIQIKDQSDWLAVSYRQGTDVVTQDGKKIPIHKIGGVMTHSNRAISISANETTGLRIRQSLTVLDQDAEPWNISELKDFGTVYWKKNEAPQSPQNIEPRSLSTDDILKKEIFSASFHPKNPRRGVISAQGIYITEDGNTWRPLKNLSPINAGAESKADYPVLIDEDGNLIVGNLRSADFGKTFHPYFRWEPLAQILEHRQKSPAYRLKIKKITPLRPGFLRFEVETQKGPLFLAAKLERGFIHQWNFD